MKKSRYIGLAGICALSFGIIVGFVAEENTVQHAVEESAAALALPVAQADAEPVAVQTATTSASVAASSTPVQLALEETVQPAQQKPQKTAEPKPVPKPAESLKSQLVIPSIGVNARVASMGIDPKDGKMSVPDDYKTVGLFGFGAYPGEKGTAVMGAHVDNGAAVNGVFKHLKNLKAGDSVYFYTSAGKKLTYEVVRTQRYEYDEKNTSTVFSTHLATPASDSLLNIITCDGTWLPGENTYDKRLVVFTKLVEA